MNQGKSALRQTALCRAGESGRALVLIVHELVM